ncbi:MAG: primosomal protein N' family DNA-binding protein, partial [Gaiellaceae bacterium]
MSRLASVYPLVTTRSLVRAFTYLVPDGVGLGAIVAIPLGGAKRRGLVTELDAEPPEGIEPVEVTAVLGSIPAPLVELALWLADYYGSTPGRALQLVVPVTSVGIMPSAEMRRIRNPHANSTACTQSKASAHQSSGSRF